GLRFTLEVDSGTLVRGTGRGVGRAQSTTMNDACTRRGSFGLGQDRQDVASGCGCGCALRTRSAVTTGRNQYVACRPDP
ncbi:hypothetical protein Q604_UNBC03910G0001, partial [human gut metagenome]